MKVLKTFKKQIEISKIKETVLIAIKYDYDEFDTQYMDQSDIDQINSDLSAGRLSIVYVQVSALLHGLEGLDSIGQVFTRSSFFEKDLLETVNIYNLTENAIKDLTDQVLTLTETFKKYGT